MAVQNEQTPAKKVELAEGFIGKYPNSDFVLYAHTFRVAAYGQMGKPKEAVDAAQQAIDATVKFGEKLVAKADADSKLSEKDKEAIRKKDKNAVFLDKNSPQFQAFMNQSEGRILALYQTIITGYQQLNDAAKVIEWGDKALGFKPDDLNTLAILSNVMAERPPTNEEEKTKQMKRAEELADEALEQLAEISGEPGCSKYVCTRQSGPDSATALHSWAGLSAPEKARGLATGISDRAEVEAGGPDYLLSAGYRLHSGYESTIRRWTRLVNPFSLKGVSEANAMDLLKQLYVQKNKSEQGLDDYVKSAGAKIGQ